SAEEHLRFLGIPESISKSPGIRQIDKLARYFFTCRDLARVARKPKYQRLFSHIDITLLEPAPRAIGCSKSACYLCDLFIRKHGRYVVSQTHGRLYEKWTIPDAKWMTTSQADSFRSVVESMMQDIQGMLEKFRDKQRYTKRQGWAPYPLESRACLPSSSNSNLSLAKQPIKNEATRHEAEGTDSFNAIQSQLRCHSWPMIIPPLIKISEVDLPWNRYVRMSQEPFSVQVDPLSLRIEFATTAIGLLSISFYRAPSLDGIKIIDALDIPTGSELDIRDSRASRKIAFCIRFGSARIIQIEFTWEGVSPV
ncbi:uncharacterized protein FOBCDRAFT_137545, partial [Fusarium oxysporum Fo47]|uniref:uncharacterized protein n=1 Tax=Fusarium oxysporum Fo47 TaxID=660027 RepID=UPI002869E87F